MIYVSNLSRYRRGLYLRHPRFSEIAKALGLSVSTVSRIVKNAKNKP
ncbi:winged helix-turn-helix transcriptional regulator [Hydrogenimonas sp.]